MKAFKNLTLLLALLGGATLSFSATSAHASGPVEGGRRVRIDDEPAGPYRLRVVTSPTPPRVENLYVEVRVMDGVTWEILTKASVTVQARLLEAQGEPLYAQATHDIAPIPNEFAAHLPVPQAGVWEITVEVQGPSGKGEVSFLERVREPPALGGLIGVGAPVAGLLLLIVVFWRLQQRVEKKNWEELAPTRED